MTFKHNTLAGQGGGTHSRSPRNLATSEVRSFATPPWEVGSMAAASTVFTRTSTTSPSPPEDEQSSE